MRIAPPVVFAVVVLPVLAVVAGCPSATPEPQAPAPSPSTVAPEPTSSAPEAPKPIGSAEQPPLELPAGAAVKSPIFSDDDCSADSDCAPVATCHPDKCVGAANAGAMPPGMMCTMECRGGTLDCNFNHCGCAANPAGKKKCAVLPGPKP